MITPLVPRAKFLHRKLLFGLAITTILLQTLNPASAQIGCFGYDGTLVSGGPQSISNGALCLNKPGAPAQLSIMAFNVADGNNPNNFGIEIDWDDGSPRQVIAFGGTIPINNTSPHTYEIPSITHVFLPRPCGNRPGAECSYRPKIYLRIAGTTCPAEFGTSPEFFRFDTDDRCSGGLGLSETATGAPVFEVVSGSSSTLTFTDRTTLNCLPPHEPNGFNASKRWRTFVYGTTNTITGAVLIGGAPVGFPFIPSGMPEISGESLATSTPPFANNNTLAITIPATAKGGEEFRIRMDYWNYCNQFGIDPPVEEYAIIRVVGLTEQSIAFGPLSVATYGDSQFSLGATPTSGLSVTYSSSNTSVATISGNTVSIVGAGTTTISAYQAGNNVYASATPVAQNLTINKAVLDARAGSKSRSYGSPNPGFTVSYIGFKNSDTESAIDITPVASTLATPLSSAGAYNIVPAGGLDDNYSFTYTNGILTISKAILTATADNKSREYGLSNPPLSISYTGFKNGESSSVINTVPIVSTAAILSSLVGAYPIVVSGGSDDNYSFSYINGTLSVVKAAQSITLSTPDEVSETIDTFTLAASTSSGLPVSFTTADVDKVSISGSIATILSPGKIIITASQSGNSEYEPATSLSQTICINPKKPTIASSALTPLTQLLTSSSGTGNAWYRNADLIEDAAGQSFTVAEEGLYQVKVTIDECSSDFSDAFPVIITSISKFTPEVMLVLYPNPVQTELEVILQGSGSSETHELTIYDLTGRVMKKSTINGGQFNTNIHHYPSGDYFLRVANSKLNLIARFVKR